MNTPTWGVGKLEWMSMVDPDDSTLEMMTLGGGKGVLGSKLLWTGGGLKERAED